MGGGAQRTMVLGFGWRDRFKSRAETRVVLRKGAQAPTYWPRFSKRLDEVFFPFLPFPHLNYPPLIKWCVCFHLPFPAILVCFLTCAFFCPSSTSLNPCEPNARKREREREREREMKALESNNSSGGLRGWGRLLPLPCVVRRASCVVCRVSCVCVVVLCC